MGDEELPAGDGNLDESGRKGEFPRLKTGESESGGGTPSENGEQGRGRAPLFYGPMLIPLAVQLLLLIATLFLFYHMERKLTHWKVETPPPKPAPQRIVSDGEIEPTTSLPAVEAARPDQSLVLSDFNGRDLRTNFHTPISVHGDQMSKKALTLSLDEEGKFGSEGSSLRIDYQFSAQDVEPVIVDIQLPETNLAGYRMLSFRLRTQSLDPRVPKLEVQLLDGNGKVNVFSLDQLFSFWKKYNYDLAPLYTGAGSRYTVKSIRIVAYPVKEQSRGSWFVDELLLEP